MDPRCIGDIFELLVCTHSRLTPTEGPSQLEHHVRKPSWAGTEAHATRQLTAFLNVGSSGYLMAARHAIYAETLPSKTFRKQADCFGAHVETTFQCLSAACCQELCTDLECGATPRSQAFLLKFYIHPASPVQQCVARWILIWG